ncbi:hypothetical protein [Streptomyces sp. TRM68367]|uniref:hypothetical protein n=1 Tax=Streptomyces sp. TRM68367 TaxID=2758415 RepID=UPI00165AB6BD|nr:hypothetical protein [Streptomyces sp. TRM68367]MBC9729871.1 hypothetical protein [Streptomyces sp. TRM68367]
MYGHGAAPPHRSEATVITLRVLFAAAGFLTCGLLACVPLFRIAILRGRLWDWVAAWVSLPVSITCLAVLGSVPMTDHRGDIALAVALLLGLGAAAHFVIADIRIHSRRPPQYAGAPLQAPTAHAPYGYPQPASPYAPTPVPQPPPPHTPIPQTPPPAPHAHGGPVPPPPSPQRPAPARIDQVRAELDELSDYLRRHDGHHEGGR